jgi:hypothetical protein
MNKKLLSILFLALLAINFQACKDDDEAKPKNEFTSGGETFSLESGDLSLFVDEHPESGDPVYKWTVFIISDQLADKWHWVSFHLIGDSETSLTEGTYTYDPEYTQDNFTFFFGEVAKNYIVEDGEGDVSEDFESGTVKVAKSGDTYTITFDVTLDGGATAKGQFIGELPITE